MRPLGVPDHRELSFKHRAVRVVLGELRTVPQLLPRSQRGHVLPKRALPRRLYCRRQPLDGDLDLASFLVVLFASNAIGKKAAPLSKIIQRPAKFMRLQRSEEHTSELQSLRH